MQHHQDFSKKAKETKKWQTILSNIEMYDGSERGQKEIEEK